MKVLDLPSNSDTAVLAANRLGSNVVVVISVSDETEEFEARCYGSTERGRYMAGRMTDAILKALNDPKNDPDPDDPLFMSLSDEPDTPTIDGPDFNGWAMRVLDVADYLKTAFDNDLGVYESHWLDPLMSLHGEIDAAASDSGTKERDA